MFNDNFAEATDSHHPIPPVSPLLPQFSHFLFSLSNKLLQLLVYNFRDYIVVHILEV